jgi:tRNA(Ile)-lysidine synthase
VSHETVVGGDAELASLLERCSFPVSGSAVTCAVSGGADSLALLALAVAAGLDVTAVHVDHGLREGSAAEADVVADAAARFGTRFRAERAFVAPGGDLEARARSARWAVLGPDALTGHTADDQAETVLINLLRGAGLDGLAGMTSGGRHPLLALRRWETVALCHGLDLRTITDPSNEDPRFVRNRVRNELLPLMEDISGRDVVPLLTRTADIARSAARELDHAALGLDPTDCAALLAAPEAVASTALRRWLADADGYAPSVAEIERVLEVVKHQSVGCQISGGRSIRRTAGVLRVEGPI